MNQSQTASIKGLFLLLGFTSSASVAKFLNVRYVVSRMVLTAIHAAQAAQKRALMFAQYAIPFGKRHGSYSSASKRGIDAVVEVIFLVIALYVVAFTLPGGLTAIATTALTSVNSAVVTLFQNLVPIIAVIVVILLLLQTVSAQI